MAAFRLVLALSLAALAPTAARADVPEPELIPFFEEGFATDAELRRVVGTQRYQLTACDQKDALEDARFVRVDLGKSDFERGPVIDALLRKAAQFAWRECPRPYIGLVSKKPNGDFHFNVQSVSIFLPDGSLAVEANLGGFVHGDGMMNSKGLPYEWHQVRNIYRETANANAQAERDAMARQRRAELRAQREQETRKAEAAFWGWVRLFLFGVLCVWAFLKREKLLYWYYSLTPHPASSMVHQAITSGTELDGAAFGRVAVSDSDNSIERRVRMDQARRLTDLWRVHERALNAEEVKLVEQAKRLAEHERSRQEAEAALLKAAIAHEQAAARVEALRKREQES